MRVFKRLTEIRLVVRLTRSVSRKVALIYKSKRLFKRLKLSLILDPNNFIDNRLISRLPFEVEQIEKCVDIVKINDIEEFYDIGANIGLYSLIISQECKNVKSFSFEPVKRNYYQFCGNIILNDLSNDVKPFNLALGDKDEVVEIHIFPESTGCSRIDKNYSGNPESFTEVEKVQVKTLDSLIDISGKKVLVKLDVEGHAVNVLDGMKDFLNNNDVYLQVELLAFDKEAIMEKLKTFGYSQFDMCDVDGYFRKLTTQK